MSIPRPEYPRPQFVRDNWQNLNGEWQFAMDPTPEEEAGFAAPGAPLPRTITVPFCPESVLSGIHNTDFMELVWYKRTFEVPAGEGRVLLHFGAVDYETTVYVNGEKAGAHRGGYASFTLDITAFLKPGENELALRVEDHLRSGKQARGKQCPHRESRGCDYTRTTGIWQTVWLERVNGAYLARVKTDTDYLTGTVTFTPVLGGDDPAGLGLRITVSAEGREVASLTQPAAHTDTCSLTLPDPRLWDVNDPFLYDVTYELLAPDGETADRVTSYVGLRGVETKNGKMYLNGRPLFQRLVLDQGFYPDGICTAPDDEALIRDIRLSQNLGFNGARLHQKVFEERFLYHADRMGYLVWGEHANWGMDYGDPTVMFAFLQEWLEVVERDYNHPAIIGWCPYNEVNKGDGPIDHTDILRSVYLVTKALDPMRPVIDVSGFFHVYPTDLYDTHDYQQDVAAFREKYAAMDAGGPVVDPHWYGQQYDGTLPLFVSEYGGARLSSDERYAAWGYGEAPADAVAFVERYEGLTEALLSCSRICAFCYTQLYDIEQEQNGLFTYGREPKFGEDLYARIRACNRQTAAIEK